MVFCDPSKITEFVVCWCDGCDWHLIDYFASNQVSDSFWKKKLRYSLSCSIHTNQPASRRDQFCLCLKQREIFLRLIISYRKLLILLHIKYWGSCSENLLFIRQRRGNSLKHHALRNQQTIKRCLLCKAVSNEREYTFNFLGRLWLLCAVWVSVFHLSGRRN